MKKIWKLLGLGLLIPVGIALAQTYTTVLVDDTGAVQTTLQLTTSDMAPATHALYSAAGGGGSSTLYVNGSPVVLPNINDSGQVELTVVSTNITLAIASASLTATELGVDSVSASELNATGVEAELEAVLDLQDLQGAVTDGQVPNDITVDLATLATTATTANSGDSATAFFSSGVLEDAYIPDTHTHTANIITDLEMDLTDAYSWTGAHVFAPVGTGIFGAYDATFGNTADYGGIRIGNAGIYRTDQSIAGFDFGGALILRQEGNLDAGNDPGLEFGIMEGGNTLRFGIPESGAGNATAMFRSVTIAGPYNQVNGNAQLTADHWAAYDGNIDADTSGTGADLFVQDDTEIEGTLFLHETINLEGATADGNHVILQVGADPGSDITISLPTSTGTLLLTDGDGSSLTGFTDGQIPDTHTHTDGSVALVDLSAIGASEGSTIKYQSGSWQIGTDATGAGGSAITLDLGDDSGNDSVDLSEIATSGDSNNIFTEPTDDKLLIDLTANWPTADDADALGGTAAASYATDAEVAAGYQPLEATLTDIADGTIAENLVNTANPWADNEVADNLTVDDAGIASTITRDTEWDTLAEINAASTDTDAVLDTDIGVTVQAYAEHQEDITILEPDSVQGVSDVVHLMHFPAERFPSGATITRIIVTTSATCTDDINVEEWTNNDTAWTLTGTVDAITLSGTRTEEGTITDDSIAADAYLRLDLDDTPTDIAEMTVTVLYTID